MAAIFPAGVYALCFLTSAACGFLLMRNYGRTGARLLFWSALCFVLLAANNLSLFIDLLVLPSIDLQTLRVSLSLAAVSILLFGFVWDLED